MQIHIHNVQSAKVENITQFSETQNCSAFVSTELVIRSDDEVLHISMYSDEKLEIENAISQD